MPFSARSFVLQEANYRQLLEFKPNLAVLPWGATEAHNFHLPHGTDNIEATALGEKSVEIANSRGAKCVLLPTLPFGQDGAQLSQVATISLRSSTQAAILFDIADSLVRQGIDRLLILNFHGGNEFKSTLRDIMLDLPIFLMQVNAFALAPIAKAKLENPGDHADEFETSLLLHLAPDLGRNAARGRRRDNAFEIAAFIEHARRVGAARLGRAHQRYRCWRPAPRKCGKRRGDFGRSQ